MRNATGSVCEKAADIKSRQRLAYVNALNTELSKSLKRITVSFYKTALFAENYPRMKKQVLSIIAVLVVISSYGQAGSKPGVLNGGWKIIDDPTNPVTHFSTPGQYKGVAWVDINKDGYIDLFAAPSKLFINNGLGNFIEKETSIGEKAAPVAAGTSWADIDNDGDVDCILAQFPSGVYTNDGAGNFINITSQFPFLTDYAAWGCAIGNQDNNAGLDMIFVHAKGFHSGPWQTCRNYTQKGSSFDPGLSAKYEFLTSLNSYTVPYYSDYDLDGDMDLFIASGPGGGPGYDFCYKNLKKETGKDTLTRMTTELFAQQLQDGQCYNFIDIDNDQDLDLCLTNYFGAYTRLYKNTNGVYDTLATPFSKKLPNLANCWGDYDNDGDLDVAISDDYIPLQMYVNDGNGNFTFDTNGITTPRPVTGIANCDYDNDGDLDFFTNGAGDGSTNLINNVSFSKNNNFISILLEGTKSNKSAIGAIVRISSKINGKTVQQIREVNAQNSFQSQNDLRVHFGLGKAMIVDTIFVQWPSGKKQFITNTAANNFYKLEEGGLLVIHLPLANGKQDNANRNKPMSKALLNLKPNPASSTLTISLTEAVTGTYEIVSSEGVVEKYGEITNDSVVAGIEDLKPGAYFVRVSVPAYTLSEKFIKQ